MNAVAVDRPDRSLTDGEPELAGIELEADLLGPEGAAPAVVVAADHEDRHAPGERDDGRGHPDAVSRDHPVVGKPEVVEIAGDQEGISQVGDAIEEGEECVLVGTGGDAEVGVRDNNQLFANHGAKGGG